MNSNPSGQSERAQSAEIPQNTVDSDVIHRQHIMKPQLAIEVCGFDSEKGVCIGGILRYLCVFRASLLHAENRIQNHAYTCSYIHNHARVFRGATYLGRRARRGQFCRPVETLRGGRGGQTGLPAGSGSARGRTLAIAGGSAPPAKASSPLSRSRHQTVKVPHPPQAPDKRFSTQMVVE